MIKLTSDLEIELSGDVIQNLLVLGKLGKSNVDRSTDCGTQVSGAESQVAETIVAGEWQFGLNMIDSLKKKILLITSDCKDITLLQHVKYIHFILIIFDLLILICNRIILKT